MGETYISDPTSAAGWTRDERAHWRLAAGLAERVARAVCPELRETGFAVMMDGDHLPERLRLRTVGTNVRGYWHCLLQFEVGGNFGGGFATVVAPPRSRDDSEWLSFVLHEMSHWLEQDRPRPAPAPPGVFEQVAAEVRAVRAAAPVHQGTITRERNLATHGPRFFRVFTHLAWRARAEGYRLAIGGENYGLPADAWFLETLRDELHALEGKPIADVLATPAPQGFDEAFVTAGEEGQGIRC